MFTKKNGFFSSIKNLQRHVIRCKLNYDREHKACSFSSHCQLPIYNNNTRG